ncbi:MAG TPA: phosphatase PAP2 family protein, partial [Actinomycetota bacterium]|nr:phosphatase PAP2 family protein [Actinomycetota bacterium]
LRGRWRIIPWLVVALVCFARIYLGAHNPLDVLGGFALGMAIGAIANLLVKVPAAGADTEEPEREAPAPSSG